MSSIVSMGQLLLAAVCFLLLARGFPFYHPVSFHKASADLRIPKIPDGFLLHRRPTRKRQLLASSIEASGTIEGSIDGNEYEYIEYDELTEKQFMGSVWLVGTNEADNEGNVTDKVTETKLFLTTDDQDKKVAMWGDCSKGKWYIDNGNFLASKESLFGRRYWTCYADDFYFMEGTIQGWSLISPAMKLGMFQAIRLDVDKEVMGEAPWIRRSNQ